MGSSWTRARARVPCIGRQTLNHCTTREAPSCIFIGSPGNADTHQGLRTTELASEPQVPKGKDWTFLVYSESPELPRVLTQGPPNPCCVLAHVRCCVSSLILSPAPRATGPELSLLVLQQEVRPSPKASGRCCKALPKPSLPRPQPGPLPSPQPFSRGTPFFWVLLVPVQTPTFTDRQMVGLAGEKHHAAPESALPRALGSGPLLSIASLNPPNSSKIRLSANSPRRKWTLREVKSSAQGHTAGEWQGWGQEPGGLTLWPKIFCM